MIYMTFALYPEAQPFIAALKLKKVNGIQKFQVFTSSGMLDGKKLDEKETEANLLSRRDGTLSSRKQEEGSDLLAQEVLLLITGTGSIHAASALSYLCGLFPPQKGDFLVNFGTCAGNIFAQKGVLYRIHAIYEGSTDRWYYPDMLLKVGEYPEASLVTVARVAKTLKNQPCMLADMEAAALYQVAQMFFAQHCILFFKTVSDRPDGRPDDRADDPLAWGKELSTSIKSGKGRDDLPAQGQEALEAADLQGICQPFAEKLCRDLQEFCILFQKQEEQVGQKSTTFSEEEQAAMDRFADRIQATHSMRERLKKCLLYQKLRGVSIADYLDAFCQENAVREQCIKKEGLRYLALLEKEVRESEC